MAVVDIARATGRLILFERYVIRMLICLNCGTVSKICQKIGSKKMRIKTKREYQIGEVVKINDQKLVVISEDSGEYELTPLIERVEYIPFPYGYPIPTPFPVSEPRWEVNPEITWGATSTDFKLSMETVTGQ